MSEQQPVRGSLQVVGTVVRVLLLVLVAMIALSIVWFLSGALGSPIARVLVGAVLFVAVAALGIGYFRQVGHPPPPDPTPISVHPGLRLAYVCEMCGLELAVLKVARERAPKHCGETMLLVRREAPAEGPPTNGEAPD